MADYDPIDPLRVLYGMASALASEDRTGVECLRDAASRFDPAAVAVAVTAAVAGRMLAAEPINPPESIDEPLGMLLWDAAAALVAADTGSAQKAAILLAHERPAEVVTAGARLVVALTESDRHGKSAATCLQRLCLAAAGAQM
jgi:hypothetical protein